MILSLIYSFFHHFFITFFLLSFRELPVDTKSKQIGIENKFDIKYYDFPAADEQLRKPNEVVVAVVQNSIVKPTTDPVDIQRSALHDKITKIVEAAALNKVNVICFQETWRRYHFSIKFML